MDEKNVMELLESEIQNEIENLGGMTLGSDDYKITVDGASKLLDKYNDMQKLEIERVEKENSRSDEREFKLAQLKDEKRDRIAKNCLTVISLISGIALTVWGTKATFEFEKEGTVTTIMGRGFINKLIPKK